MSQFSFFMTRGSPCYETLLMPQFTYDICCSETAELRLADSFDGLARRALRNHTSVLKNNSAQSVWEKQKAGHIHLRSPGRETAVSCDRMGHTQLFFFSLQLFLPWPLIAPLPSLGCPVVHLPFFFSLLSFNFSSE